jgi:WS/DGAT C-terminal domain
MRSGLGDIYATYAATFYSSMFVPYKLLEWFSVFSTMPYTMAFSNTPGLLKSLTFDGRHSIKM